MQNKTFTIGNRIFEFLFTHKPFYEDENTVVLGYPYNMDIETFDKTKVNLIKGYYAYIKINSDSIEIINDILGNYRMYYMEKDGITYFSNDFLVLFDKLSDNEKKTNLFEMEYWKKHRYTTGGETICCNIHKIKPAHIYKFTNDSIKEKLYFKNIHNHPNRQKLFEFILSDLRDSISKLKQTPSKKVLLFSGGADSTLLAKLLQEQNIEFTPVFIKIEPSNKMNFDDTLKVQVSAKKLGIVPEKLTVNITKCNNNCFINDMFMDRSTAFWTYDIYKQLKDKYGEDIIILSGETADSILNYGPTSDGFGDFIARNFMFSNNIIVNKIYELILHLTRTQYKNRIFPKTKDFFISFFDEIYYKTMYDKNASNEYYQKIHDIVDTFKSLDDKYSLMMYLKIYGFLQGSDQQVFLKPACYNNCKTILLFATPQIVYSVIQYSDFKYEIRHPKSVVYKILKDVFNYQMPRFKNNSYKQESSKLQTYQNYEKDLYNCLFEKMNSLNLIRGEEIL